VSATGIGPDVIGKAAGGRRLIAVVYADMVGYSRLISLDDAGTLRRLRTLRRALIDPAIRQHGGKVVQTGGDSLLLAFDSIDGAVRCAVKVQQQVPVYDGDQPPDRRIRFRVGIDIADAIPHGTDLHGEGVNIAARLQAECPVGGICVSRSVRDHVHGRLDLAFQRIGQLKLKNIAQPVEAFVLRLDPAAVVHSPRGSGSPIRLFALLVGLLVVGASGTGWWLHQGTSSLISPPATTQPYTPPDAALAKAPRLSIVVLPFDNLSGDPQQDYFADGITDDLTTDLSHLPDSFVISRGTAFTYKGKPVDAKKIGLDLGVRYVLEGSVREVGETITVNAQLISTDTGAHVWADRFDGERSRLGELQVEVVARLANSLGVELVKAEAFRLEHERPGKPDAVDLAMRGRAILYSQPNKAALKDAQSLFERALAIDAQNVSALVNLALTLNRRLNDFWSEDPASDLARAEETIDRALALQPQNSWAHQVKGRILFHKRQWRAAIAEEEAAIADDSNNAAAHASASVWKMFIGRAEDGFGGVETALRLSPHDLIVPVWQSDMCELYMHLAQWEQAIEWCRRAIAGSPNYGFWFPYVALAAANAWAGHEKEARETAAQLQKVRPGFTVQTWAGIHWTDDPTFNAQYARIVEGLRKAGVPEGQPKTN
jgi:adenylate cyclase